MECGIYKGESHENMEEYFKKIGVSMFYRKGAVWGFKLAQGEFRYDSSNDTWVMQATAGPVSHQTSFRFSVPFQQKYFDGRTIKTVIHKPRENVWVEETIFAKNLKTIITREFRQNELHATFECDNVVGKQVWKKIN